MGVEVPHHVPDDPRALAVRAVGLHTRVVHPEQYPAMHGLEAVPHVGQRPADDHAHGVIEVRRAHLVGDLDLLYAAL